MKKARSKILTQGSDKKVLEYATKQIFRSKINAVLHGGIHSLVQDGNHGLHPSPILPNSRDGWRIFIQNFPISRFKPKKQILYEGEKDKIVFDICFPQIQESAESRHL